MPLQSANRFEAEDRRPFNPAYRIFAVGLAIVMAFALLFAKLYRLQLDEGDRNVLCRRRRPTTQTMLPIRRARRYSGVQRRRACDEPRVLIRSNSPGIPTSGRRRATCGSTESLRRVIEMIEEDGGQVIDTFRIVRGEDGNLVLHLGFRS